ncbi:MAG: hypothetical protein R6U99_11810 [Nioella sp.]
MPAIVLLAAAILMALIWATDLTATLGAHPWWSGKVVWIGAPIGLALAWALTMRFGAGLRSALFLLALGLAGSAAYFGKVVFVTSFAGNTLAGQFWFFGWIASMAALAGLLANVFARLYGWIRARQPEA